jgi:chromosome segregation ATPase
MSKHNLALAERIRFQELIIARAEHTQRIYRRRRTELEAERDEAIEAIAQLDTRNDEAPGQITRARQTLEELRAENAPRTGVSKPADPIKRLRKKQASMEARIAELEAELKAAGLDPTPES